MPDDVFRWVIAVAVVLAAIACVWQAVVLAVIVRAGARARQASREFQSRIGPMVENVEAILANTRQLLEENRPRIADISAEAVVIGKTAREQAERISELLTDVNARAKTRIAQIDHTVDQTVEQVEQLGEAVKSAVMTPAREVSGIVNGVKAAAAAYAQSRRRHSVEQATQDEEMFI